MPSHLLPIQRLFLVNAPYRVSGFLGFAWVLGSVPYFIGHVEPVDT
jgi:hypothetical protein